ncbi:hypothetical protein PC121_g15475 [Phytophthora cactorum]|nr:hypothetical protein PC121_g15475 [Phytophthora cactorum]KAG4049662.1 hypothetical protein PC123_g15073 [Phytophthora cactorum]
MVVEDVVPASTITTQALPLCPLVGWNHGSTFLVMETIALSHSFAFFLCLTCPAHFLISTIALTIRLLSSTGTLPLGVYTSSAVSLGGCQRTWLRASVELVQLGARDAASEIPPVLQ